MLELIKSFVRLQGVRVDARTGFDVLADHIVKFRLAAGLYDLAPHFSAALQNGCYNRLPVRAATVDLFSAFVSVHISSLAADDSSASISPDSFSPFLP